MDELELLRAWYRYNADLRRRYLRAIAKLPRRAREGDDGASYPLFSIFLHVLDAYRWWFRYVYHDAIPKLSEWEALRLRTNVHSTEVARREMIRIAREVLRFVDRLSPKDLDKVVEFRAPTDDNWTRWRRERLTLRAMVWHLVEEELQHRGEMNALMWRHGVEPPIEGFHEWWRAHPEAR